MLLIFTIHNKIVFSIELYMRVWLRGTNVSCQLKFRPFVSFQLNFRLFVSCQLNYY